MDAALLERGRRSPWRCEEQRPPGPARLWSDADTGVTVTAGQDDGAVRSAAHPCSNSFAWFLLTGGNDLPQVAVTVAGPLDPMGWTGPAGGGVGEVPDACHVVAVSGCCPGQHVMFMDDGATGLNSSVVDESDDRGSGVVEVLPGDLGLNRARHWATGSLPTA